MISIVDYGLGNIQAFFNIYSRLNIPVRVVRTASELERASHLILPGVGAFDWAVRRLEERGLREVLEEKVTREAVPILGVCVGLQVMAKRSEEGVLGGLGWLGGEVRLFKPRDPGGVVQLPHMGWNDVTPVGSHPLFKGLSPARFYFLHSYYVEPAEGDTVLAHADYQGGFACAVGRGHVMGVQFHPEKSHGWGMELLRNFAQI